VTHIPASDFYELLEVSPQASASVIRAAYRALALTWHTDVNADPEAEQRIRELNAAYDVLSDPRRRAAYDLQRARIRRALEQRDGVPRSSALDGQPRPWALVERRGRGSTAHSRGPTGQAILALVVLAALITAVLVLFWVGMAISDDTPPGVTPIVEVHPTHG
jgi:curved DNA-binding protein CbpA